VQKIVNEAVADLALPTFSCLINDGSNELAQQFVDDARIDLISFTGSSAVGRQVGVQVAKRMGKVLLELGGNNAIIVDEHANLELAVPAIVFGAVGTAGQRCTTTRRVIVHESRLDELRESLVKAYGQVRIGDPLDPKTLMGPLIDPSAIERVEAAIESVRDAGGEILCGGERLEGDGNFMTPAIAIARNDWDIVQTETFGPLLYLLPYKTLDEAIEMQNGVVQGLSSSLRTSTSARPVPRSAAHSAAKRKRAAAARRARMPGARTCGGRPTPSTGARKCRWRRASISTCRTI
jgi:aldehyde dehydrogenase (NAD+)